MCCRQITLSVFAPALRADLKIPPAVIEKSLAEVRVAASESEQVLSPLLHTATARRHTLGNPFALSASLHDSAGQQGAAHAGWCGS